jgi:oxygen-independent coproporphyrinogen III oxidase
MTGRGTGDTGRQRAATRPSSLVLRPLLGLYLHIPFCSHICNYCNFNRGLFDAEVKRQYVDALATEIARAGDGSPADTIFFGGGTPSLLDAADVRRLVEACRAAFDVTSDAEVTLETNPETVTVERMRAFLDAGVNRISLGVQSLHDAELARLGRQHGAARARVAVADIRTAGVENLSLDLMLWLPQQTPADWHRTVEGLIALQPDHASLYILELYPNAPLREEMARAQWSLAPDDDAADMYLWGLERLDAAGYAQYEISNIARPGCQSRHNLKYWQDGAWLGFGCGAHSTRGPARWKNIASTTDYIARIGGGDDVQMDRRERSVDEQIGDALFTGLRLTEGLDFDRVGCRYGVDLWSRYREALQPLAAAGRLTIEDQRVRLTRDGMLVANDIMQLFV